MVQNTIKTELQYSKRASYCADSLYPSEEQLSLNADKIIQHFSQESVSDSCIFNIFLHYLGWV